MYASGFLDTCVEVRELAGFFPGYVFVGVFRDGGLEFGEKALHAGGVLEEVVEDCAEHDGCGVAAGCYVGGCPCCECSF